jgi:hypothetical protein
VQTLRGNLTYPRGEGYACLSMHALCTISSISNVVIPGRTAAAAISNTSLPNYFLSSVPSHNETMRLDSRDRLLAYLQSPSNSTPYQTSPTCSSPAQGKKYPLLHKSNSHQSLHYSSW